MYNNCILTNVPSYRIIDEVQREKVCERGGGGGGRGGGGREGGGGEDILVFNSMSYK